MEKENSNSNLSNLALLLSEVSHKLSDLQQIELAKLEVEKLILKELQDDADEGKAIYNNGTLSTIAFTIIDTQISPGHPVKGYAIRNTGTTNIFVAHNIVRQPQLDADIVDTLKVNPIFFQLVPNEIENVHFNRNKIKSVHLLAVTGIPTYKIKLVW